MNLEGFSAIEVAAATHPPGYAFHKYWARKPHNVVRRALEACGVRPGDVVLDPFCGSGVPLSEAAALGARCVGVDVNPVAVELTRTTLCPPDPERFRTAFSAVLDEVEALFADRFTLRGRVMRYAVHATVVRCPGCARCVSADAAPRRGRTYACPHCDARLGFNLERLVATRVLRAVLDDGSTVQVNDAGAASEATAESRFDHEFQHNSRILAHAGMRTRRLFTARNFAVLTAVAERVAGLPEALRSAAGLTLTAAVAQCSRLIAHRNGLTSGGPAWTVPGFWVPPVHLEANPLHHLRARLRRTLAGLKHLHGLAGRGASHVVTLGDAGERLRSVAMEGRASVVFLDPPYGDSVPYLEFSAMWNSFLGAAPDPGQDLSVSDRARGDGTWSAYEAGLARVLGALNSAMTDDARVLVTFNNHDLRAWRALLGALQREGLRCAGAFYQHPAVVSAKAQLAREGSYVGDVYCVFTRSTAATTQDLAPVAKAVREARAAGVGEAGVRRVAMTAMLRANVAAACVDGLRELL